MFSVVHAPATNPQLSRHASRSTCRSSVETQACLGQISDCLSAMDPCSLVALDQPVLIWAGPRLGPTFRTSQYHPQLEALQSDHLEHNLGVYEALIIDHLSGEPSCQTFRARRILNYRNGGHKALRCQGKEERAPSPVALRGTHPVLTATSGQGGAGHRR